MAKVTNKAKAFADYVYGRDSEGRVGLGVDTSNYANRSYANKKTTDIVIGTINRLLYLGYEVDREPLVLVSWFNASYQVIEGVNVNYLPVAIRRRLLDYVKRTNRLRIKSGKPIMIDYHQLKTAIPEIQGAWRRYKLLATRNEEIVKFADWDKVITESTKYQNHYKTTMRRLRKYR